MMIIDPIVKAERLGFKITAKGGPIHSPGVVKSFSSIFRVGSVDSYALVLYDEFGNKLEKDYINADRSFFIFPYIAKHRWDNSSGTNYLVASILESPNNNRVIDIRFGDIDIQKPVTDTGYSLETWEITQNPSRWLDKD